MDINKVLESKTVQVVSLLIGLAVAIALIFDFFVSPTLQSILIGVIVLVALYFLALTINAVNKGLLQRLSQEVTRNLPPEPPPTIVHTVSPAEQAYSYFASRYGIGYDLIQVHWTIANDGSATLQRIIEIEAFSKIENLDTYLLIPESSEERQIDFVAVDSLTKGRTVSLSDVKKELGRLSALTTISPPLNKGEKIRYSMSEKLPKGLYAIDLTSDELSKRESDYDYCGWNINRPTRKISVQVEFPQFFKPNIFSSEVRYASASGFASVRTHYEEEQKSTPTLTLGPAGDRFLLKLEVDYPMLGLIYILRWRPIAKDDSPDNDDVSSKTAAKQDYLAGIRTILIERFDEGELRTLTADLGVDYDSLPGQGKANKARELVSFLERRDQLSNLVEIGKQQRPNIAWPPNPD